MSSLKTFLEEKETAMMKAFVLQCKKNIIQLEKEASEAVKLYKDKIDLQKALLASFKDWDDDEMTEEEIKTTALADTQVLALITNKTVKKVIVVPNRLINIVVTDN